MRINTDSYRYKHRQLIFNCMRLLITKRKNIFCLSFVIILPKLFYLYNFFKKLKFFTLAFQESTMFLNKRIKIDEMMKNQFFFLSLFLGRNTKGSVTPIFNNTILDPAHEFVATSEQLIHQWFFVRFLCFVGPRCFTDMGILFL